MNHFVYESVGIKDIAQMAVSLTLDDQPIPPSNQELFVLWAARHIAHENDLKVEHLYFDAIDIMPVSPDGYYFSIEGFWFMSCDFCLEPAINWTSFDAILCGTHLDEAIDERNADLQRKG